jgi:chitin synthase
MLVTCYSEGEEGLRTTFDSLALTSYCEDYKLLFIVADGLITGSGNSKSTPDLIIDMLEMDKSWPLPPPALSYFSLADGSKEHNKAQVYAAWYNCEVNFCVFFIF